MNPIIFIGDLGLCKFFSGTFPCYLSLYAHRWLIIIIPCVLLVEFSKGNLFSRTLFPCIVNTEKMFSHQNGINYTYPEAAPKTWLWAFLRIRTLLKMFLPGSLWLWSHVINWLWRELKGKSMFMGNPDVKVIEASKTFALTSHQFFSSLWYKQGRL